MSLHDDILKSEGCDSPDEQPIHTACGLPVELCTCPDAPIKYYSDTDMFEQEEE